MSFTRVLIGSAEKPKRNSGGVSFLQDNRLQLCNFAFAKKTNKQTPPPQKKKQQQQKQTMFKVSNRNTRNRCLLISKIALKISERRHLTTSYLR